MLSSVFLDLAAHLKKYHGTPVCLGTPFEKHCTRQPFVQVLTYKLTSIELQALNFSFLIRNKFLFHTCFQKWSTNQVMPIFKNNVCNFLIYIGEWINLLFFPTLKDLV